MGKPEEEEEKKAQSASQPPTKFLETECKTQLLCSPRSELLPAKFSHSSPWRAKSMPKSTSTPSKGSPFSKESASAAVSA